MPYYNIPLPPVQEGRGILWLLFQLLQKLGQRVHIEAVYAIDAFRRRSSRSAIDPAKSDSWRRYSAFSRYMVR